tara:strand:+ start:8299 stop:9462 length:1164 start_codon:yes stop_codon:yes gene_type:complete
MKIALIPGVFFPQPGGAQVQTHNLANKLIQMGHKVDVLLLNKTNVRNNFYNILIINKFILSLFFYLNEFFKINLSIFLKFYFKKIIEKNKYDIFHFQLLNFKTLFILKILKDLDQKVIVTFQGIDIQIDKNINYGYRLNKSYEKKFLSSINKIDKFFSISENIRKDLLDLGVNNDKIIMIPNAVEKKKFLQLEEIIKDSDKKIYLVTVARFAKEKKGFDLLPKIAKLLIERKINFQWTIVGNNSKNIKTINNMGDFEDNFVYLDNIENLEEKFFPHNDLIKVYKKNHIYVNLARVESFGITIIEALASGLPVITFDTKGGNELIKNDYNGIIVKNLSSELMVNAIFQYNKNIDLYEKHKTNAVKSIESFDLSIITKKTIKGYEEVIN